MTRKPLRVGLVGTGYIADYHRAALKAVPHAQLVAVCDLSLARAESFADRAGVEMRFSGIEQMLDSAQLDVVHVLTPPNHHVGAATYALNAGADVFVEKPLALDRGSCRELIETAARAQRRLGVGHNFLFTTSAKMLLDDLATGELGPLDQLDIVWNRPLPQLRGGPFASWMFERPENILLEIGSHPFSIAGQIIGLPDRLTAHRWDRIELPNGREFFRKWEIIAWKGAASIRIRLSMIDGVSDFYIRARGVRGTGLCDLERDVYHRSTASRWIDDVDRFALPVVDSVRSVSQALRVALGATGAKLGSSRHAAPYGRSINQAVTSFYDTSERVLDSRLDPVLAETAVILAEWTTKVVEENDEPRRPLEAVSPALAPLATGVVRTVSPSATRGNSNDRVLVTGANGFIGRSVVDRLLDQGHVVRAMVRDPDVCPRDWSQRGVELMRGDMKDAHSLSRCLEAVGSVIHLARAPGVKWNEFVENDIDPTTTFARLVLESGAQRFVFSSSVVVYNAGLRGQRVTEETAPRHTSDPYARSKIEAEKRLYSMYSSASLPLTIVRPGVVVGAGSSPFHWGVAGWPQPFVARLWGSGDDLLPFVLVTECADAIVRTLTTPGLEGESINIVGPPLLSANDYLDRLEDRCRTKIVRVPTQPWRHYSSSQLKWAVKGLGGGDSIRPSFADWQGRTFASVIEPGKAARLLDWRGTDDVERLISSGIDEPVEQWFQQ